MKVLSDIGSREYYKLPRILGSKQQFAIHAFPNKKSKNKATLFRKKKKRYVRATVEFFREYL